VGVATDMTVLEFCVGMALARRGSLTAREIAGEVSTWLDKPVALPRAERPAQGHCGAGLARPRGRDLHAQRSRNRSAARLLQRARADARWRPPAARCRCLHVTDQGIREERIMNHRQCIALLAASSLTLAGTAPLRAADSDGVEVRQSEDALYCTERKLGTWFYCEKPEGGAAQGGHSAAAGARTPCRDRDAA